MFDAHTHIQMHRDVCRSGLVYFSVDEIESGIVIVAYTRTHSYARIVHVLAPFDAMNMWRLTFTYSSDKKLRRRNSSYSVVLLLLLFVLCLLPSPKVKTRSINLPAGIFTSIRAFLWNCFVGCVDSNKIQHAMKSELNCSIFIGTRTLSLSHTYTERLIFTHGGFIK